MRIVRQKKRYIIKEISGLQELHNCNIYNRIDNIEDWQSKHDKKHKIISRIKVLIVISVTVLGFLGVKVGFLNMLSGLF